MSWTWSLLAVAAAALFLFPYSAQLNNPNERTRVLQTRAIVEHRQLHIGETFMVAGRLRVRDLYGREGDGPFVNDVALVCQDPNQSPPECVGRIYPAKAPGTSLLGVPALALARAAGVVDARPELESRVTWLVRVGGVLPLLLVGLWLMGRELALLGASGRFVGRAVLATGLGTTLFTYSLMFVGHAAAGAALLSGLTLLRGAIDRARWARFGLASLGGLAASSAVLLEYHAAAAVAAIGAWTLLSSARRWLLPGFLAGGLLAFAAHAWLHVRMFRSALRTGHFFLMTAHNRAGQSNGFLGIDGLHREALRDHLLDFYMGLVPLMPWLAFGFLLACAALYGTWRAERAAQAGMLTSACAIVLVYLAFVTTLGNWREMNGWSVGPRYLTPCLFPAALFASYGWWWTHRRAAWLSRLCAGLAAASIVIVVAVTAVYPSPPPSVSNVFGELAVPLLREGYAVRNVLMHVGSKSLWFLVALVAPLALWVALGPDERGRSSARRVALGLALALSGAAWLVPLTRYAPTPPPSAEETRKYCRNTVEGLDPNSMDAGTFFR